jgi:RloB-like protein
MPKPKSAKHKRVEQKELLMIDVPLVPRKQKVSVNIGVTRMGEEIPFKKSFLIVCEGPTEAAYFEGLCATFDIRANFQIEVLPQKDKLEGYKGSSIKGLLYVAMEKQKKQAIPFDEVWLVTDNDEGNAYILSNSSLERIRKVIPTNIYEKLKAHQFREMNVREIEKEKNKHLRFRYFLCQADYQLFLETHILELNELQYSSIIIQNTSKNQDFLDLYSDNPIAFFYDDEGNFISKNSKGDEQFKEKNFDKNWRNYVKIAYSCISFEYWLLLHFNHDLTSFYNSREIIKHFDDNGHFDNAFEKGWYLYEKRDTPLIKAFFNETHKAILNNIQLIDSHYPHIVEGEQIYEINPYTDVFRLTSLLLNNQNTTLAYSNEPIEIYRKLRNLNLINELNTIQISFIYERTQPMLRRNIESLFSVLDKNHSPFAFNIKTDNQEPICKGDSVSIEIKFENVPPSPVFLYFKENEKGTEYALVWVV